MKICHDAPRHDARSPMRHVVFGLNRRIIVTRRVLNL